MIWNPEGTVKVISGILGAVFIIVGTYKIMNYVFANGKYDFYNYDMVYGIIAIIIGIVTVLCSTTIASIFRIIIGIWIVYTALIRISVSIKLKKIDVKAWVYTLILAIIMFLCGLYIILNAGTLVVTIGVVMIVYSIIDIILNIIFIKNVKEIF